MMFAYLIKPRTDNVKKALSIKLLTYQASMYQ